MQMDTEALELAIEEIVSLGTAIEVDGETLVVTGVVNTPEQREAIHDILDRYLPDVPVQDNIEVGGVMPERIGDLSISEVEMAGIPGAEPGLFETESLEPGDFTDQSLLSDPMVASGPSGTHADDDVSEGDDVHVPPTDPAYTGDGEVLGGFQIPSDQNDVMPSSQVIGGAPDSAIAVIRRELREDASTTALEIEVTSENGIVHLRGVVDDLYDAINAQAVAARIDGVIEVRDELQIRSKQERGLG